jgi:hypothetical protein
VTRLDSNDKPSESRESYLSASYLVLELLGIAHGEFPIIPNKSQRPIHAWWVATLYSHLASGGGGKPTHYYKIPL